MSFSPLNFELEKTGIFSCFVSLCSKPKTPLEHIHSITNCMWHWNCYHKLYPSSGIAFPESLFSLTEKDLFIFMIQPNLPLVSLGILICLSGSWGICFGVVNMGSWARLQFSTWSHGHSYKSACSRDLSACPLEAGSYARPRTGAQHVKTMRLPSVQVM